MGYNYKTTNPTDTDFIYQAPTNVMMQAIQTADNANDQQIQQADLLGNAVAKVNYLPTDQAAVKKIQDSYNQQIDDATNKIISDPTNYQKHMPLIRSLTRDLTNNLQDGELASYQAKANALATWDQANHQKVVGVNGKPGTVSPEAYQAARAKFLQDYSDRVKQAGGQSYNPQTKTSIPLNTEDLYDTPDINKAISDATEKIKANSTSWKKDSTNGKWIYTGDSKNESVERARVAQVAQDTVSSDPDIMGYLKQGSRLGYVKPGTVDAQGNLIAPYSTDAKGNISWNSGSALTPAIRAAVGRDAYVKSETGQSMKDDPYGLEATKFGHEKAMAVLKNQMSDASAEGAAELANKSKKDLAILHTALSNGESLQSVMDKLAGGTSKTQITASPDGVTTISPFAGDGQLTSDKLNKALIPQTQADMADLLAKTKDPNLTDNQRGLFQQQYDQQKALYDQYSQWNSLAVKASTDKLLTKYTPKDLAAYQNYIGNTNGMKTQLTNTKAQIYQQLQSLQNPEYEKAMALSRGKPDSSIPQYTDPTAAKALIQHQQVIDDQLDKFQDIGDRLARGQDNWYKDNSKETNLTLKGVGLSVPNKQIIYDRLKANPDVQIHDLNTDSSSATKSVQGMLQDVVKSGGNLSDYMDIQTINPPAPGVGTTVTFKLKDKGLDANKTLWEELKRGPFKDMKDTDLGKTMVMTLPSDLLHSLGNSMKNNGESDSEKNIGGLITNESKSELLSSLSNRVMTKDSQQPVSISTVYDPASRQRIRIKLVPVQAQGTDSPQSYKAYVRNAQGQDVLFSTKDNPQGEFASTAAVVDAMMPEDKK